MMEYDLSYFTLNTVSYASLVPIVMRRNDSFKLNVDQHRIHKSMVERETAVY